MKVLAVIGDLVDSRSVGSRDRFQRELGTALARTSRAARQLASPYTLTLGDEFQAVYRGADTLFGDVVAVMAAVHPVQARVVIGVGELSTRINHRRALGMDGPAFHAARTAMTALKRERARLTIAGPESWALANHTLSFLSRQFEGWSRNRLLILAALLRGAPVREIEAAVKISRVAVYKNLRAGALDDVVGICQELTRALNQALRER